MDPARPQTVADFVTDQVTQRHLSRTAVAAACGVARQTLYRAMAAPRRYPHVITRLAELFAVDPDWLAALPPAEPAAVPTPPQTELRRLVHAAAEARNVSVDTVVRSLPVSRSTLYQAMAGRHTLTPRTAGLVADGLGLPVEQVLTVVGLDVHPVTVAMARAGLRSNQVRPAVLALRDGRQARDPQLRAAAVELNLDVAQVLASQRTPVCDTSTRLGALVDATCAARGVRLSQLARQVGSYRQYLMQLLAGTLRNPSRASMESIAAGLGVSVDELDAMLAEIPLPHATEGDRLARRRTTAGLTRGDVAAGCGVAPSSVTAWETGRLPVPARHRSTIETLLGADTP